jgi:uncharacterized membrane protein
MKQERLKSKVVWLAVLAQVLLIVGLYIPDIANEVKIVGSAAIEIATLFGILNNPTDKESF